MSDGDHWLLACAGGCGANGEGADCCQWARMSADVCRRGRLLGGSDAARACITGGGGGGGWLRSGDACPPPPMEPYVRRVLIERLDGIPEVLAKHSYVLSLAREKYYYYWGA